MKPYLLLVFLVLPYGMFAQNIQKAEDQLPNIPFDIDKYELSAKDDTLLNIVIKVMRENPKLVMEVDGRAYENKDDTGNYALSMYRALECKNYISAYGIEPLRLVVKALAATSPIVEKEEIQKEGNGEQREIKNNMNRWVTFKVIGHDFKPPKVDVFNDFPATLDSLRYGLQFYKAYYFMANDEVDSAKFYIDKAAYSPAIVLYLKGFIYKELYNKYVLHKKTQIKNRHSSRSSNNTNDLNKNSTYFRNNFDYLYPDLDTLKGLLKSLKQYGDFVPYRDTAIYDLFYAFTLERSTEIMENIFPVIKYLAACYYNNVFNNIDTVNFKKAIAEFNIYKFCMIHIEPSASISEQEIPFNNIIGGIYANKMFNDTSNTVTESSDWDSAYYYYNYVLDNFDSVNHSANYGLLRLCYNYGVKWIGLNDSTRGVNVLLITKLVALHLGVNDVVIPFGKEERDFLKETIDKHFSEVRNKKE